MPDCFHLTRNSIRFTQDANNSEHALWLSRATVSVRHDWHLFIEPLKLAERLLVSNWKSNSLKFCALSQMAGLAVIGFELDQLFWLFCDKMVSHSWFLSTMSPGTVSSCLLVVDNVRAIKTKLSWTLVVSVESNPMVTCDKIIQSLVTIYYAWPVCCNFIFIARLFAPH